MNTLFMKDILIYLLLLVFILYMTYVYDIWGIGKGNNKAKKDTKDDKKKIKKRNRTIYLMQKAEYIGDYIGFPVKSALLEEYDYRIGRMDLRLKTLGRHIKAIELLGIIKAIKFISFGLGLILFVLTWSPICFIFFAGCLVDTLFMAVSTAHINDEDIDIEAEFPNLYVTLCTQLYKGSYTRLSPTLDDYLKSLEFMHGDNSYKAIRRFVLEMRKNIEIYGDDSMAINKLRTKYRSAMVINFCNLAVQSLGGVDNKDKLIAFKIELQQKKIEAMKKRANRLVEKGRRAIWVVYAILAQFVVLSWIAKLGGSGIIK